MKNLLKIWVLCAALLLGKTGIAVQSDSSQSELFEAEKKTILQRIGYEKGRIVTDYRNTNMAFLQLVDSVTRHILTLDVPEQTRNLYLSRLQVFLQNIDRYYSASYLQNGTYLAVLSYYPVLIEWDQKDELLRNLKRYSAFSIKATRLIPNDTVAEDFLSDYMKDYPDDIFRYAEEFDDRRFAVRLLERALKRAPESAKRYYSTGNTVDFLLRKSNDAYVKKSYEIYGRYGIRSRAYLLLDDIVTNKISIGAADSAGVKPEIMFGSLVQRANRVDATLTFSMYRFLDNYSVEAMRKIDQEATRANYQYDSYKKLNKEEMFVLLMYGYNQTTMHTFQAMMELLHQKSVREPVSTVLIGAMDKEKLKQLVIYCDKNQLLDNLLAVVDDKRKNYLLELTTLEEKEELMPPFKTFGKESAQAIPEYRVMNESTKARPPKYISADSDAEAAPAAIEKPKEKVEINFASADPKSQLSMHAIAKADIAPIPSPEITFAPIKIELDERAKTVLALKKNILNTIQNIPAFIEKEYAEEVLLYAAQKEPDEMLQKIDAYKRKYFCKKVLEQCAYNAPVSVKRYLYNPRHAVNYILQYSNDPVIKRIFEINPQLGYHSKPMLLLDDIVAGQTTVKDAVTIGADPNKLFSAMVKIISRPKYIGRYSIDHELRDYSLRFVREINDKIASGSSQPFYSVEAQSAAELYFLMLYGRDEVFTSTFNGLFNRFMQKIPAGEGAVFLQSVGNNKFRDFISLCSSYGVLEEFLAKFKPEDKKLLLGSYIANLESERDNLSSVVLVAEALSNLTDIQLLTDIQTNIRKEYERVTEADDKIGISLYGVLSSIIAGNARTEEGWYKRISQQFRVSPASMLPSSTLFTGDVCIEQMYFYNDDDGRSSFINFMNTYKSQSAWTVEDKYNYVRIYSNTGAKIEILANKPEYNENGVDAINNYLKEKKLMPTIIVHRGHSFHTESTLEKVPSGAKLVFVGSCGGFYKISIALENAPEAHIISTKQVGTKTVNDAMIYALNEQIRNGKDIVWNDFWDKMREKFVHNQYFSDYIPPNKNLESTFIRAYYKILGV